MVQDEVGWVLDTIRNNWPAAWPADDDGTEWLYRINRDEPTILETGERTKSVELDEASALGASLASRSTEPVGTEYDHRVETVVGCRLEGLSSQGGEWGHIDAPVDAETLVRYAQHALLSDRSYPTVPDAGDGVGSVAYHSLFVEDETNADADHADYFRTDWDVRLVGYSSLP